MRKGNIKENTASEEVCSDIKHSFAARVCGGQDAQQLI